MEMARAEICRQSGATEFQEFHYVNVSAWATGHRTVDFVDWMTPSRHRVIKLLITNHTSNYYQQSITGTK